MATFNGSESNDTITGGADSDVINGNGGNDSLLGGDGSDTVRGGAGNDFLSGNTGTDWVEGGAGNDEVRGGSGQDSIAFHEFGAANADQLTDFDAGWDNLQLDAAAFTQIGATGRMASGDARFYSAPGATGGHDADDRIVYNSTTGQLFYDADGNGAGAAQLIATITNHSALAPTDIWVFGTPTPTPAGTINGTEGNDSLVGTSGNDTINGFGGNDTLNGAEGADRLNGGDGNDVMVGGPRTDGAADTLDGGLGDDQYEVYFGDVIVADAGGVDWVIAGTSWTLGAGLDNLRVGGVDADAADAIGNELDNIIDGSGLDHYGIIDGGAGNDLILGGQRTVTRSALFGGDGNDTIRAQSVPGDSIFGGTGNDSIVGYDGFRETAQFDTIDGGTGNDTIDATGTFVFSSAPGAANADTLVHFDSGRDTIQLDASVMSALGTSGRLSTSDPRFYAAPGASSGHDVDDRIIYDTSSGRLWYDRDGSVGEAPQLIATLQGAPSLAATDIVVANGSGGTGGSVINGTEGDDSLVGTAGNDTINAFGGNDTLDGGPGADQLNGGTGNDRYIVTAGDTVSDPSGVDTLVHAYTTSDPGATLPDGIENGILIGSFENMGDNTPGPFLVGNSLDNVLRDDAQISGLFIDLDGGAGNDTLIGGQGTDRFRFEAGGGNYGNDVVQGSAGSFDMLYFGTATTGVTADIATGTASGGGTGSISFTNITTVIGGAGADMLIGGDATNRLYAGAGNDTLIGGASNDFFRDNDPYPGLDIGTDDDSMVGNAGDDSFELTRGNDFANGGSGNDQFGILAYTPGHGTDTIVGGDGIDSVSLASSSNVVVDLGTGTMTGGTLSGIENFSYSAAGVATPGDPGNFPTLRATGSATSNVLMGSWGNDTLEGGAGNDTLTGGPSGSLPTSDSFVFSVAPGATNADTITDFERSVDHIVLDAGAHASAGASGALTDGRFYAAAGATSGHDADDRAVYDTATGNLYWDADGNGAGTAQLIATLQGAPAISGSDITIANGTTPSPTPSPTPTPTPPPPGSIVGTAGNDDMSGTAGNDSIFGLAGNDTIFANGGDDWVQGGAGNDSVSGGSGQDRYAFAESGATNADQILNYGSGWDSVHLDAAGFGAIGATGRFAGGDVRFFAAAGATSGHDADDRIVYNTSTGQLFYDADGSGAGASQLIATFTGAPSMAATDITVFGTATPSPTPSPTPTPTPGAINGTEGNDSLVGTDGNDSINGFGGNDTMDGRAGNDTMVGGSGDDVYIVDRLGNDVIVEAENGGIDEVRSSASYTLPAWVNNLTLFGFASQGIGNDIENVIDGRQLEGADLWGMGGNDLLMAGDFSGIHQMHGGDGNDTIQGGSHTSQMFGDGGNDVLQAGSANDTLTGGTGNDSFLITDSIRFTTVTDFASAADELRFDGRSFTGIGASGDFAAGDGRFYAAPGANSAHDADDRLIYNTTSGELWYSSGGSVGAEAVRLVTVLEGAPTLAATDIAVDNGTTPPPPPTPTPTPGQSFSGTTGNDTIVGSAGNDTMFGNSGNDWLEGRGGNDQLSGGSGLDSYVFREFGAANADTLLNFDGGNWDSLRFDNAAFTALGPDGHFSTADARFFAAAGATGGHDADDRIVYNTTSGQLYYDADGAGGADAQLIATIQGATPVVAPDIWVI
jgi:Ca2+-binding RTX toxin-like protein